MTHKDCKPVKGKWMKLGSPWYAMICTHHFITRALSVDEEAALDRDRCPKCEDVLFDARCTNEDCVESK